MFFRLKATGPYQYLQIAESLRVDGKIRQRILATLGRLDLLQESGQLDSLLRSGLRFSQKLAVQALEESKDLLVAMPLVEVPNDTRLGYTILY